MWEATWFPLRALLTIKGAVRRVLQRGVAQRKRSFGL
jgi:hypothetical protein